MRLAMQQAAALQCTTRGTSLLGITASRAHTRTPWAIQSRFYSSQSPYQAPTSSSEAAESKSREKHSHTSIYRQFGRPFAKVFFTAMFVYQVLYWSWEKMRLDEVKEEATAEIKDLERQVEEYKAKKTAGR